MISENNALSSHDYCSRLNISACIDVNVMITALESFSCMNVYHSERTTNFLRQYTMVDYLQLWASYRYVHRFFFDNN